MSKHGKNELLYEVYTAPPHGVARQCILCPDNVLQIILEIATSKNLEYLSISAKKRYFRSGFIFGIVKYTGKTSFLNFLTDFNLRRPRRLGEEHKYKDSSFLPHSRFGFGLNLYFPME